MRIVIMIVLLIGLQTAEAQSYNKVSGFMGKRWSAGFGMDMSFSQEPQDVNGKKLVGSISINKMFQGQVQYVLKNYRAIGARMGISSTSSSIGVYNLSDWTDTYNGQTRYNEISHVRGNPGISDIYYGLYYRWFRKRTGALAPIGNSFSMGFNLHNYTFDYSGITYYTWSQVGAGDDKLTAFNFSDPIGTATYPEVYLELGRSVPIGRSLLMEFSLKGAYLMAEQFAAKSKDGGSGLGAGTASQINSRLTRMYILNYGLKLSFMP